MKYFIAILVLIILGGGAYFLLFTEAGKMLYQQEAVQEEPEVVVEEEPEVEEEEEGLPDGVIGYSEEGREIRAYTFGTGDTNLVFVGGLHGAYSWNTVLLAYEIMDYLKTPAAEIPENVMVTVIPITNPDGLHGALGSAGRFSLDDGKELTESERVAGRFNANMVDLNRNFDCNWEEDAVWRDNEVDAGDEPFSEAETMALRDYFNSVNAELVVAYYGASGDVIASSCGDGILPATETARDVYAEASGYNPLDIFTYYPTTGDMTDWLAKMNIPAISVVLESSDSMEWTENRAGIEALLEKYAE